MRMAAGFIHVWFSLAAQACVPFLTP